MLILSWIEQILLTSTTQIYVHLLSDYSNQLSEQSGMPSFGKVRDRVLLAVDAFNEEISLSP